MLRRGITPLAVWSYRLGGDRFLARLVGRAVDPCCRPWLQKLAAQDATEDALTWNGDRTSVGGHALQLAAADEAHQIRACRTIDRTYGIPNFVRNSSPIQLALDTK